MVLTNKLTDSVTPTPWRLQKRVLPQHTDHAGVMWHGAYVAWLEEARVEALVAAGLTYVEMTALGVEMPVVSLKINYRHAFVMAISLFWKASVAVLLVCAGPGVVGCFVKGSSWLMHRLSSSWCPAAVFFDARLVTCKH